MPLLNQEILSLQPVSANIKREEDIELSSFLTLHHNQRPGNAH